MKFQRSIGLLCAILSALGIAQNAVSADSYPNRPVRLIVPNAAGSSVDTLGRIFANAMTVTSGQQFVVDNRAGAGGLIGMEIGKDASPDGYTLVSASTAAMVIGPHVHKKLPFSPLKDYEFVSLFGITPNILVVNPSLPVKSVKELIDYTRSKNNQVNMASAGAGSQSHLAGVMLMNLGKFQSLHVPYKGGGPSVAATVAGESQWTITPAPAVAGLVKSGKLRAIAQSLTQRSELLGDLPPISDTIKGFEYSGWNGLLAPRGTPKPVLASLRSLLLKATENADFKANFARQMTKVETNTPEQFRKFVEIQIRDMGPVVKAAGLQAF